MADLESQIRKLADRRFASTSPVNFAGETNPRRHDRSDNGAAAPINGTEMIMYSSDTTRPWRARYLMGAAAALVAIAVVGVALIAGDPAPEADAPVDDPALPTGSSADEDEIATAFFEALAAGDRDTALGLVNPDLVDSSAVSPYGRARTLAGQFDWYEAVDWQWTLEECAPTSGAAACTVTATNAWSDALGVEPVSGDFVVRIAEGGIMSVNASASFTAPWESMVFDEFSDWVRANHPDDAAVMWNFSQDVDSEILALFEANTERFVDAQRSE